MATTTALTGTLAAATPTTIAPGLLRTLGLSVDDGGASGVCQVQVNAEADNGTANSHIPCNGIMVPIICEDRVSSLTLTSTTAATYCITKIIR